MRMFHSVYGVFRDCRPVAALLHDAERYLLIHIRAAQTSEDDKSDDIRGVHA
jgi:hypothetical protein